MKGEGYSGLGAHFEDQILVARSPGHSPLEMELQLCSVWVLIILSIDHKGFRLWPLWGSMGLEQRDWQSTVYNLGYSVKTEKRVPWRKQLAVQIDPEKGVACVKLSAHHPVSHSEYTGYRFSSLPKLDCGQRLSSGKRNISGCSASSQARHCRIDVCLSLSLLSCGDLGDPRAQMVEKQDREGLPIRQTWNP